MSKDFKTATELIKKPVPKHIIGLCIRYKKDNSRSLGEYNTVVTTTIEDSIAKACKHGTIFKPKDVTELQIFIGMNSYFIDITDSMKLEEIKYEK